MPEYIQPVATRRRRYTRSPSQDRLIGLTPTKVQMLSYLAELRFLSMPQLAKLCCPSERRDLSEKSARRHMREMFDAGLVNVLPVSRAALAPPGAPNNASLLHGSAPNVYAPTAQGLKLLREAGFIGEELLKRSASTYGPKNSLFLAHELAVRDVRVWLEASARAGDHEVEDWRDGQDAVINLGEQGPTKFVRPDSRFAYRLGRTVLVGLVEVDRGTERGERRWAEKLQAYATLFASSALRKATGYINARVLVFAPDTRRRDGLAELLAVCAHEAGLPEEVLGRFWITENGALEGVNLQAAYWRRPRSDALVPLVSVRT